MELQRFTAMLLQRGYRTITVTPESMRTTTSGVYVLAPRADGGIYIHLFSFIEIELIRDIEVLFEQLANGQRHMQCQCGYPLLMHQEIDLNRPVLYRKRLDNYGRSIVEADPEDANTVFVRYRAVSRGLDSQPITTCPACCSVLSSETVKEIEID